MTCGGARAGWRQLGVDGFDRTEMPICTHCGRRVSVDFASVYGDDGAVDWFHRVETRGEPMVNTNRNQNQNRNTSAIAVAVTVGLSNPLTTDPDSCPLVPLSPDCVRLQAARCAALSSGREPS